MSLAYRKFTNGVSIHIYIHICLLYILNLRDSELVVLHHPTQQPPMRKSTPPKLTLSTPITHTLWNIPQKRNDNGTKKSVYFTLHNVNS